VKLLQDILYKAGITEVHGSTHIAIESVTMDSRKVKPISLFVAVKGYTSDGHSFIDQAIAQGAAAVVCGDFPEKRNDQVTYIRVQDPSHSLGVIASNFYDNPSQKLTIVAITGTNGKTTTTTLLHSLFRKAGYSCGLLSTVVNRINDREVPATHTTPDQISLQQLLASMVEAGCTHCFMEASSHALHQQRLAGMRVAGALFTNITHDHLDYHGNFNEYIKAKKLLFDQLGKEAFALVNADDRHAEIMVQNCKAKVKRFALQHMAEYRAKVVENSFQGLHLSIDQHELYTRMIGGFNAYNILAAYAVGLELGMDRLQLLTVLSELESPAGRFQHLRSASGVTAIVDYAHTPDALQNVLDTISEIRSGNEQVITIVGCGGDRDRSKRPVMASIAVTGSDRVVLTSDNPRSEEPEAILNEMKSGLDPTQLRKVLTIPDRSEAIRLAVELSGPGDIILVAGKGHEQYQEIKGERHPFDDFREVNNALRTKGK